jgi:hypothetical protein
MIEKLKPLTVGDTTTSGITESEPSTVSPTESGFVSDYTDEQSPLQETYIYPIAFAQGSNNPEGYAEWRWKVADLDCFCPIAESHGFSQEISRKGVGMTDPSHVACYSAVIEALGWIAVNMPDEHINLIVSSRLVVQQVNGVWPCRTPYLLRLRDTAAILLSRTNARLLWLPKETEKQAEILSSVTYGDAIAIMRVWGDE